MDSILVTGGCGFIGRNMVRRIREKDENTIILIVDDLSQGKHPDLWLNYHDRKILADRILCYDNILFFIEGDLIDFLKNDQETIGFLSRESGFTLSKAFSLVYHFASIVGGRLQLENEKLFVARNLSIDAELFYWASQRKPGHLFYPSSSAVYPIEFQRQGTAVPLREEMVDFGQLRRSDLTYGWSKLNGEYLAKIYADSHGLKVTCVRPFSGYGPDQDAWYPMPAIVSRFVEQENPLRVWGTGKQSRDFIYIDDLLDGIELAMAASIDGQPVNLGTGIRTTFLEVISHLVEITLHDPVIECLSDKPEGVFTRYADVSHMESILHWTPKISLIEGLQKMLTVTENR